MHRTTTALTLLAVPLTALGLLGARAVPATADDVSWDVRTAANDFGADRPNYGYTLNPGGRLTDGLVVVNHGAKPLHLAVYAADGFTAAGGRLDLLRENARSTKVGAWVRPDRPGLTVPPGRSAEATFTVALPGDAAPGEYMGGIVTQADTGRRLGIRIRLRVGGALRPSLTVENPRVRYAGTPNPFGTGGATVTYTIHNTGNAIVAARQTVSLSGPFGRRKVRTGQADSPQLLPGERWRVSVPVRGAAPLLRLTGTVTVVPLVTDAAGSVDPLPAVKATAHTWIAPWVLPLVLVVLCGLVAAGLTVRRRRARRRTRRPDPA